MPEQTGNVERLAEVLRVHEARWTTYGDVRTYQRMHCAGDCQWWLRQTSSMSDDHCYERHRHHVATVLAEQRAAWEAEARRSAVAEAAKAARGMHDPPAPDCVEWADWLDVRADLGPVPAASEGGGQE